jgi:hypothetical protein
MYPLISRQKRFTPREYARNSAKLRISAYFSYYGAGGVINSLCHRGLRVERLLFKIDMGNRHHQMKKAPASTPVKSCLQMSWLEEHHDQPTQKCRKKDSMENSHLQPFKELPNEKMPCCAAGIVPGKPVSPRHYGPPGAGPAVRPCSSILPLKESLKDQVH